MKKIIHHPISRIILGVIISIALPVLINKLILKNLFNIIGFEEQVNGAIRIFISTLILIPLFYAWFYRKIEKRKISELDLRFFIKESALGFFLAVLSISFILLLCTITINVDFQIIGLRKQFIIGLILILGFVTIEEFFFRGIIYRITEEKWGTNIALIISGVLFGLMHITNPNINISSLLSIIIAGLLLGVMYSYKRRLWLPIFFHYGWNLSQVIYGVSLSGTDEFSKYAVFRTNINGPDIISGGEFGLENSIFTIIFTVILFVILYIISEKKKPEIKK